MTSNSYFSLFQNVAAIPGKFFKEQKKGSQVFYLYNNPYRTLDELSLGIDIALPELLPSYGRAPMISLLSKALSLTKN
jgi:hypothetical protein